uniref:Melanopsin n=1 Tax=Branchiostoma belcheri TaxID=7741 RepID=OPN4_BRABE|nr:RecName: Full=Melanopsin; AltName: Full=Opsin-4; AltName: Full=amphi-MOP [Branchiostoma belcheri]BAE00065.1 melanopsin [Branchiostoma belcheri]
MTEIPSFQPPINATEVEEENAVFPTALTEWFSEVGNQVGEVALKLLSGEGDGMEVTPTPGCTGNGSVCNGTDSGGVVWDIPPLAHYIVGTAVFCIGCCGMFGNAVVVYSFIKSKGLRTPANFFIINLALSDFLMNLTNMPIFAVNSAFQRWLLSDFACELYGFAGGLFGCLSINTLMAISMDRYLVITKPFLVMRIVTKQRVMFAILLLWIWSLVWALPPLFGWSAYVSEGFGTSCTFDYMTPKLSYHIFTYIIFFTMYFIPGGVMIYCYYNIFATVKSGDKQFGKAVKEMAHEDVKNKAQQERQRKNEIKTAKIAFIVISLFMSAWTPYAVVSALGTLGYQDLVTPYLQSIPAMFAKSSAVYSPIVYAITYPKFREAVKKHIPCLSGCLPASEEETKTKTRGQSSASASMSMTQTTAPVHDPQASVDSGSSVSVDDSSGVSRQDTMMVKVEVDKRMEKAGGGAADAAPQEGASVSTVSAQIEVRPSGKVTTKADVISTPQTAHGLSASPVPKVAELGSSATLESAAIPGKIPTPLPSQPIAAPIERHMAAMADEPPPKPRGVATTVNVRRTESGYDRSQDSQRKKVVGDTHRSRSFNTTKDHFASEQPAALIQPKELYSDDTTKKMARQSSEKHEYDNPAFDEGITEVDTDSENETEGSYDMLSVRFQAMAEEPPVETYRKASDLAINLGKASLMLSEAHDETVL